MAEGDKTVPAPPAANKSNGGVRFLIEFGNEKNSSIIRWPIDEHDMRGRWGRENLPGVEMNGLSSMPNLPGTCLYLDSSAKTAIFLDPLGDPDNAAVLKKAQEVVKKALGEECGAGLPNTDCDVRLVYKDMSDDDLKTYCYWARRVLDAQCCRVASGRVPEMGSILATPGKIAFGHHAKDTAGLVYREAPERPYRVAKDRGQDVAKLEAVIKI